MHQYAVEATNLSKTYNGHAAVDNISLAVREAEIFGILGPNGAGKTTLIDMLVGLKRPTAGEIRIMDLTLRASPIEIKKRIGHVYADMAFFPHLTAVQNLSFFGRFYNRNARQLKSRISELLEFVGLPAEAKKRVGVFSHGMKQRLGFARALINDPRIVFLDEATSGIDVRGTRAIRNLVYDLRAQGRAIVIASHELAEIELVCDRIALLDEGKLLVVGSPDDVKAGAGGMLYKYRVHVPYAISEGASFGAEVSFLGDSNILVASEDLSHHLREQFGEGFVDTLKPTLEDVFLWHVGEKER